MAGIVNGLVIQTNAMESGKFALNKIAMPAATTIWKGIGMKAQKSPTANALETERRFKYHKLALCNKSPNICIDCQTVKN